MIKGVLSADLRRALRIRLKKLAEVEAMPDPGPDNPSERSNQLFLLAFRKGSVRELVELIVLAEHGWHKVKKDSNDWDYYKTLCDRVLAREKKRLGI